MLKKLHNLKSKKGFTLVELIIVIAIIAVLAAILIPTMMGFVKKSRITANISSAQSISNSIAIGITENMEAKGTAFPNGIKGLSIVNGDVKILPSGAATTEVTDTTIDTFLANTIDTFKTGVAMVAIDNGKVVGVGYNPSATAVFDLPNGTATLDDYGTVAVANECTVGVGYYPTRSDSDSTHTKNNGLTFYAARAMDKTSGA